MTVAGTVLISDEVIVCSRDLQFIKGALPKSNRFN